MVDIALSYNDHGLPERFERAPAVAQKQLQTMVTVGIGMFHRAWVQRAPVGATGVYRGSIQFEVRAGLNGVRGRAFSTDLPAKVGAIETGRAPGRMPPPNALGLWAMRKGLGENVGFLIARAIGRRGTRGRHSATNAFNAERARVQALGHQLGITLAAAL